MSTGWYTHTSLKDSIDFLERATFALLSSVSDLLHRLTFDSTPAWAMKS